MPQSRTDGLDDGEEVAVFISLTKVKNMHPLNLLGHFPNGQWGLQWREGTPTTATAPVQLSPAARSSPGPGTVLAGGTACGRGGALGTQEEHASALALEAVLTEALLPVPTRGPQWVTGH